METISTDTTTTTTRAVVYAGLIAAAYAVLTIALGSLSYGPLQLRVAGLLKPLALRGPTMAMGLAVGVALANLASPFGAWDFVAMPIVSYTAAMLAWQMRWWPWLAMVAQATLIAVGVAIFPLRLGGGIPVWPTVVWVFVSEATLYLAGLFLLKRTPLFDEFHNTGSGRNGKNGI